MGSCAQRTYPRTCLMRKAAAQGVRAAAARWPRYGAAQLVGATPPTVPFRSTSGPLIVGVRQLSSTSSGGITITSTKGTKDAGGGDGGGGSGGGGGGGGDGVDMELEQRIADLQRQVRARFAEGSYHEARELAEHCKLDCVTHFGRAHPATASVINNIALCSKQLGEYVRTGCRTCHRHRRRRRRRRRRRPLCHHRHCALRSPIVLLPASSNPNHPTRAGTSLQSTHIWRQCRCTRRL